MHFLLFKITHMVFGPEKSCETMVFLIKDAIYYRRIPRVHTRLGYQLFHAELHEDTYRRWKET